MAKPNIGTILSCRVEYPDGRVFKYYLGNNSWDNGLDDLAELFRSMLLAMGYAERHVNEMFGEETGESQDSPQN